MAKIPVGKTIAYAYGFTFGHFLTILGLCWLPLAIAGAGAYLAIPPYIEAVRVLVQNSDASGFAPAFGAMLLFGIVAFLCFNMIYVGIARQALGLRSGFAFFYFSLDRAFWMLIGAYLLALAIYAGIVIAAAIGMGIVTLIATFTVGPIAAGLVMVPFLIVFLFGVCYAAFRAIFFLAPVAVAEGKHVLRRSWNLGGGNFWRILGVSLCLFIPLIVIEFIGMAVIGANLSLPEPPPNPTPEQIMEIFRQMEPQLYAMLPIIAPVIFILDVLVLGLMVSAQSFAYRALVPANKAGGETENLKVI